MVKPFWCIIIIFCENDMIRIVYYFHTRLGIIFIRMDMCTVYETWPFLEVLHYQLTAPKMAVIQSI